MEPLTILLGVGGFALLVVLISWIRAKTGPDHFDETDWWRDQH